MGEPSCAQCGASFIAVNRQRKLCAVCQILRDYPCGRRSRRCTTCKTRFHPLRRTHKRCPACAVARGNTGSLTTCATCGAYSRKAPSLTSHCLLCVTQSRAMYEHYVSFLRAQSGKT